MAKLIRVGLERRSGAGGCLAWALDYPGLHAKGEGQAAALIALPLELTRRAAWTRKKAGYDWMDLAAMDMHLEEFATCTVDARRGGEVRAWFPDDARSYDRVEAMRALQILAWARGEIFEWLANLDWSGAGGSWEPTKDRLSALMQRGLEEEIWLLSRMHDSRVAAIDRADLLEDLTKVRAETRRTVLDRAGSTVTREVEGEKWSPRKLLRRLVAREIDLLEEIQARLDP